MNSLLERMSKAHAKLLCSKPYGFKPVGFYLGEEEWKGFSAAAKAACEALVEDAKVDERYRVEFRGVPVYKVETKTHFNVA